MRHELKVRWLAWWYRQPRSVVRARLARAALGRASDGIRAATGSGAGSGGAGGGATVRAVPSVTGDPGNRPVTRGNDT